MDRKSPQKNKDLETEKPSLYSDGFSVVMINLLIANVFLRR